MNRFSQDTDTAIHASTKEHHANGANYNQCSGTPRTSKCYKLRDNLWKWKYAFHCWLVQFLESVHQPGGCSLEAIHHILETYFPWFKSDGMGLPKVFAWQDVGQFKYNKEKLKNTIQDYNNNPYKYDVPKEYFQRLKQKYDDILELKSLINTDFANKYDCLDKMTNHGVIRLDTYDRDLKDRYNGFDPKKSIKKRAYIKRKDRENLNEFIHNLLYEDEKYENYKSIDGIINDEDFIDTIYQHFKKKFNISEIRSHINRFWHIDPQYYDMDDDDDKSDLSEDDEKAFKIDNFDEDYLAAINKYKSKQKES